jgi:HSP20 family protein
MERSYGSFQRVLSLPEDADQESVSATFRKGVLTVTMPRKAAPQTHVKQIEIQSA